MGFEPQRAEETGGLWGMGLSHKEQERQEGDCDPEPQRTKETGEEE